MSEYEDREELARLIYEAEQRTYYGHVKTPWGSRPAASPAKRRALKVAEQLIFAGVQPPQPDRSER